MRSFPGFSDQIWGSRVGGSKSLRSALCGEEDSRRFLGSLWYGIIYIYIYIVQTIHTINIYIYMYIYIVSV